MVGEATCSVGGTHGHVVDVVCTCVGRQFEVGRSNEAERACAAVDAELGTVGTDTCVNAVGHARACGCGVGGSGVFGHAGGGATGKDRGGQNAHIQCRAGSAFVAGCICQCVGEGTRTGAQRRIRRECACGAVVGGCSQNTIHIQFGRVDQTSAHLNAGRGVVGVGGRAGRVGDATHVIGIRSRCRCRRGRGDRIKRHDFVACAGHTLHRFGDCDGVGTLGQGIAINGIGTGPISLPT